MILKRRGSKHTNLYLSVTDKTCNIILNDVREDTFWLAVLLEAVNEMADLKSDFYTRNTAFFYFTSKCYADVCSLAKVDVNYFTRIIKMHYKRNIRPFLQRHNRFAPHYDRIIDKDIMTDEKIVDNAITEARKFFDIC